jgi:Ca2+-binding RTX toxin-like protein
LVRTAPVITSNGGAVRVAFSTGENVAAVQTVTVDDADGPAKLYSLGGADAALFSISAAGVLSFRAARDFETPTDAGKDNIYNVRVTVNDGAGGSDFQDLAITVRNVLGNVIAGSTANNTIDATHKISGKGSTGEEDKVDGKAGNDTINTGGGNDTLIGGLGKDVLTGGAGLDKFVFNAALNSAINVDTIKDFAHDLDLIQLDDAIFKKIGAKLDAGELYAKAGAVKGHDANDRIIYDKATGKLYFDDDGSGSRAAIWFATLSTKPQALDHGDFGIV